MLAEVTGRNDDLSKGDVVVWQEEHFEQIAHSGVVVDAVAHGTDELDDALGHLVTRGCLSSEEDYSRDHVALVGLGHVLQR